MRAVITHRGAAAGFPAGGLARSWPGKPALRGRGTHYLILPTVRTPTRLAYTLPMAMLDGRFNLAPSSAVGPSGLTSRASPGPRQGVSSVGSSPLASALPLEGSLCCRPSAWPRDRPALGRWRWPVGPVSPSGPPVGPAGSGVVSVPAGRPCPAAKRCAGADRLWTRRAGDVRTGEWVAPAAGRSRNPRCGCGLFSRGVKITAEPITGVIRNVGPHQTHRDTFAPTARERLGLGALTCGVVAGRSTQPGTAVMSRISLVSAVAEFLAPGTGSTS